MRLPRGSVGDGICIGDGNTGEGHAELGASTQPFAGDLHPPSVKLHEPLHDGEADAQSALHSRVASVGLGEEVEHAGQHLRRDAHAIVPHPEYRLLALTPRHHLDPPARLRVLRGVRDEVDHDLLQPAGVAGDVQRLVR